MWGGDTDWLLETPHSPAGRGERGGGWTAEHQPPGLSFLLEGGNHGSWLLCPLSFLSDVALDASQRIPKDLFKRSLLRKLSLQVSQCFRTVRQAKESHQKLFLKLSLIFKTNQMKQANQTSGTSNLCPLHRFHPGLVLCFKEALSVSLLPRTELHWAVTHFFFFFIHAIYFRLFEERGGHGSPDLCSPSIRFTLSPKVHVCPENIKLTVNIKPGYAIRKRGQPCNTNK